MTVRSATFDDIPALREMMRASMAGLGSAFYPEDRAEAASAFLTMPDEALIEDGTLYVVEASPHPSPLEGRGDRIVAVGGWSSRAKLFTGSVDQEALSERLDPRTDAARIRAFFVHPELARRGLARLLYERCEQAAREAGFRSLSLMATLPGVPLYRALGFGEERPTTILLPDGSELECVEMKKSLR